ncbi:ATP-grasp domain-containing protein [soil metagenome]
MNIAILSRGDGWHVQDLLRAAMSLGHTASALDFRTLSASIDGNGPLAVFDAVLIRTMPAGSLEQIIFRMDLLHAAEAGGQLVLNPPRAVECCVDKFLTSVRLYQAGIPTPPTAVCQTLDIAMNAFVKFNCDVVVKPLFGSEGRGMVRLTDIETAWRTFHAIVTMQDVIYVQQFVPHPGWDVRAFVINGEVIAAMKRSNVHDWRTNVAQGGTAEHYSIGREERELALAAAKATGAIYAGVDLLPTADGWQVIEVNAVPGWRALATACEIDVARQVIMNLIGAS